jgi:hypothetical protein
LSKSTGGRFFQIRFPESDRERAEELVAEAVPQGVWAPATEPVG